jgi:UDP-N-acetylmuramoylalanine--D-glutamate ligase
MKAMTSLRHKKHRAPVRPVPAIAADIDWSRVHALVCGLGESGLACATWLARRGAQVSVVDSRPVPPMAQIFHDRLGNNPRVQLHAGVASPFAPSLLEGVQMMIASPGLSPHAVHGGVVVGLLRAARDAAVPVLGEIDLFEWAIHYAAHATSQGESGVALDLPFELPKVLAITGTNGKTTTTQMTTALLRRAGIDAQEAGNISPSLMDAVMAREDASQFPQVWVLELSSFQLAIAQHFHPTAAAILNITEDHLDWHENFQDYYNAKVRILGHGISAQDSGVHCVINRDDPTLLKAAEAHAHVTSFGMGVPPNAGDFGLVEEGISWMCVRDLIDEERLHRLMPTDALRVRGRHNAMNALAALALCRVVTPALAPLLHGLREFQATGHRVQWIAQVQGIDFIDDSKGTNVGATAAALRGLGQRVVLIAGGEGKGQDFMPLKAPLAAHAVALVTIGRDGPVIAEVAHAAGVPVHAAASMSEAIQLAFSLASPGEAVLLSPACASFDMFDNYLDRARAFAQAVQSLAEEQGALC